MVSDKTYGGYTLTECAERGGPIMSQIARDLVQAQEKLARVTELADEWAKPRPNTNNDALEWAAGELREALSDTPPTGSTP